MGNTLEDVLVTAERRFALDVGGHREKYSGFLERQLKAHPVYDLDFDSGARKNPFLYVNVLADKVLFMAYFVADRPVIAGYKGHEVERRIIAVHALYLLKCSEIGASNSKNYSVAVKRRTDRELFKLHGRVQGRKKKGLQNWGELIDELGADQLAVEHFGQEIDYGMILESSSPDAPALLR